MDERICVQSLWHLPFRKLSLEIDLPQARLGPHIGFFVDSLWCLCDACEDCMFLRADLLGIPPDNPTLMGHTMWAALQQLHHLSIIDVSPMEPLVESYRILCARFGH